MSWAARVVSRGSLGHGDDGAVTTRRRRPEIARPRPAGGAALTLAWSHPISARASVLTEGGQYRGSSSTSLK